MPGSQFWLLVPTVATGFGAMALASLLDQNNQARAESGAPHHKATAKNVIFLFMEGGPSHIDTFDPKPELEKLAGQPLPASYKPVILAMGAEPMVTPLRSTIIRRSCVLMTMESGPLGARSGRHVVRPARSGVIAGCCCSTVGSGAMRGTSARSVTTTVSPRRVTP